MLVNASANIERTTMKNITFAAALVLSSLAIPVSAQSWLTQPCEPMVKPLQVPTTAAKPVCLPAPQGAGTAPIVETNEAGAAAAWWCKGSAGNTPKLYLYAVRWNALTTALATDLVLGALSSSKTTAIQTTTAKHQTSHILDMCDVWGPAAKRISAARPPL